MNSSFFYALVLLSLGMYTLLSMRSTQNTSPGTPRYAFVTLASDDFSKGALILGYTLQKYHPETPRILLHPPEMSKNVRHVLSKFWVLREVDCGIFVDVRMSFCKFYAWDLIEFEKVVYLDSDTFLLSKIDGIFDYDPVACVSDCAIPQMCNSGVIVLKPRWGLAIEIAKETGDESYSAPTYGDQPFFNRKFPHATRMAVKYNLSPDYFEDFKEGIVHALGFKPWNYVDGMNLTNIQKEGLVFHFLKIQDEACIFANCSLLD